MRHRQVDWGLRMTGPTKRTDVLLFTRPSWRREIGRDPVGIPPPNIVLKSQVQIGERKNPRKWRISALSEQGHVALRTFE
jgi:hypothetical protein